MEKPHPDEACSLVNYKTKWYGSVFMDSLLGFKFNTCIPAQHLRCWTALIYLTTLMLHFCCWTRESMPAVITLSFIRFVSYPFSITGCNTEILRLISTNTSPQHALHCMLSTSMDGSCTQITLLFPSHIPSVIYQTRSTVTPVKIIHGDATDW